jgi:hypothetical protein
MEAWNVVGSVSAAVAALAALSALYVAWKTLQEGRDTIAELQKLRAAAQADTEAAREATEAARETTRALHVILTEGRLGRELDVLRSIASQVRVVVEMRRLIRENRAADWHEFNSSQALLTAQVAGASVDLPKCSYLASPRASPQTQDDAPEQATEEIRAAIDKVKARLVELNAAFPALLKLGQ